MRTDRIRTNTGKSLLILSIVISMVLAETALAGPADADKPDGLSEESWEALRDNRIEWDELGDLVQYYNPTYTAAFDTASDTVTELEMGYSSFVRDMWDTLEETNTAMDQLAASQKTLQSLPAGSSVGSQTREEALAALESGLAQAKAGRSQITEGIRKSAEAIKTTTKTIERSLLPVKKQLTQAMQGVMISYEQLIINREMLEKQASLYETILQTRKDLRAQNNATDYEVQSAENDLAKVKASLSQLDSTIETVRRSMGLQLGWSASTLPDVGSLPDPDPSFVDTTNPDADKTAAIMHNSEVISAGKAAVSSSYGYELRDLAENETTGKLVAKMDALYADMKQKKALYETAQTTAERARLTKESAERKYRLGLLSRAEYESQMLANTSYEAACELAKLNLFQSINTYQWAVDGYVSIG